MQLLEVPLLSLRPSPLLELMVYVGPEKLILIFDGRPVTTIVFFAVGPAELVEVPVADSA